MRSIQADFIYNQKEWTANVEQWVATFTEQQLKTYMSPYVIAMKGKDCESLQDLWFYGKLEVNQITTLENQFEGTIKVALEKVQTLIEYEVLSIEYEPLSSKPKPMVIKDIFTHEKIMELRKTILTKEEISKRKRFAKGLCCQICIKKNPFVLVCLFSKYRELDILKELYESNDLLE